MPNHLPIPRQPVTMRQILDAQQVLANPDLPAKEHWAASELLERADRHLYLTLRFEVGAEVTVDGEKWRIANVGALDDDLGVYLMLSSVSEQVQQKNGTRPRSICGWSKELGLDADPQE